MNIGFVPAWPNTEIGTVKNRSFANRIIKIGAALFRVLRGAPELRSADVIIARNLDLLALAWATRLILGKGETPLIYECLDIHGVFTRTGLVGKVMRFLERRLLQKVQLVIVSSPGFITHYFQAVQGHTGPFAIVENKLWFDNVPVARPSNARPKKSNEKIRLGWVGSIRCAASLKILSEVATRMADNLTIEVHGNIHRHALPDFDDVEATHPNITVHGPYDYPDGLLQVYGGCDLVWAQDLWQRGANSDWLLPNRIYEASWFGCPSIAVADTQTGRKIQEDGLGYVIGAPNAIELEELLLELNANKIQECSNRILQMDDQKFRLSGQELDKALTQVLNR